MTYSPFNKVSDNIPRLAHMQMKALVSSAVLLYPLWKRV